MKQIGIRRAGSDDAPVLSKLSKITFLDTFQGTCTKEDINGFVEDFYNEPKILKELQNEEDFYFIAISNGVAAGYFRMKEEEEPPIPGIKKYKSIELKRLYVLKAFLGQKVGAALMQFALEFAHSRKYEAVWLGVWEHNERAKAFYNKWGFTFTGVTHDFPIGNTPQTDQWLLKVIK